MARNKSALSVIAVIVICALILVFNASLGSTATKYRTQVLPIFVSQALSSSGQFSNVLLPESCIISGDKVTAVGTFTTGYPPTTYARHGDVVELYVYSGLLAPFSTQVGFLSDERAYSMGSDSGRRWDVTVQVDVQLPKPMDCYVAVQSTFSGMGAGNAF
jgi:hypothetical protein